MTNVPDDHLADVHALFRRTVRDAWLERMQDHAITAGAVTTAVGAQLWAGMDQDGTVVVDHHLMASRLAVTVEAVDRRIRLLIRHGLLELLEDAPTRGTVRAVPG